MAEAVAENEFDVEGIDDGEGNVEVKPSTATSPEPPAQPPATAPATPEAKKPGRPRKQGVNVSPIAVVPSLSTARVSILTGEATDAPKDARDLWIRILDDAKLEGYLADQFVIYVYRMMGPQIQPMKMPERIYGEQVGGDPDNGVNPGDALIDWLTEYFHMGMVTTAASYQLEFCWRQNGHKIKKSDSWPLDAPHNIEKMRRRLQQAGTQPGGGYPTGGFQMPPPMRPRFAPAPMQMPPVQQTNEQPVAPPAAAATRTGDPYVDRLLDAGDEQRRIDREEYRRREEEARAAADKREALLTAQLDEMRLKLEHVIAPQPVQPQVVVQQPAQPVETEEQKQAKLAALIAQTLMQTLIAGGVIKPGQSAAPTTAEAQQATTTLKESTDTIEHFFDQMERLEKMKLKARKAFGLPEQDAEEEDEDEDDDEKVEMRDFGGLKIPKKFAKDANWLTKFGEIAASNPSLAKELLGSVVGAVASKIDIGQLMGLLSKNPAAVAALQAAAGSAMGGGGGGFTPPTA